VNIEVFETEILHIRNKINSINTKHNGLVIKNNQLTLVKTYHNLNPCISLGGQNN
jgi:hypothetical protein